MTNYLTIPALLTDNAILSSEKVVQNPFDLPLAQLMKNLLELRASAEREYVHLLAPQTADTVTLT
jgi:hypothetical protein